MKKRVLSEVLMCMAIAVSLGACGSTAGETAKQKDSAVETLVAPIMEELISEAVATEAPATEVLESEIQEPIIEDSAKPKEQELSDTTSQAESEETGDFATLVDGMRPDFKEAMDSYEAFYDEYCDFMKKYNENSGDLTLIMEYGDMLTRSAEMSKEFEEWNSDDLNDEEMKYYFEVSNRVTQKLAEVAY